MSPGTKDTVLAVLRWARARSPSTAFAEEISNAVVELEAEQFGEVGADATAEGRRALAETDSEEFRESVHGAAGVFIEDEALSWRFTQASLRDGGFAEDVSGVVALIAERRALWEALSALQSSLRGLLVTADTNAAIGNALKALESSWLADPANREGGA